MGVSLSKGGNVSLTKEAPGLTAINVGLGWKPRVTDGAKFDLDASAFLCNKDGKVATDTDFVFYNNKVGGNGSIEHTGDNTTGEGDGDDEIIKIDLSKVPAHIERIIFGVTIHEAKERGQNFGQVDGSVIRVVNAADGTEITKYDLGEDYSTETAMIFGELYRHNADWKFKAVGAGFAGGLGEMAAAHGIVTE